MGQTALGSESAVNRCLMEERIAWAMGNDCRRGDIVLSPTEERPIPGMRTKKREGSHMGTSPFTEKTQEWRLPERVRIYLVPLP